MTNHSESPDLHPPVDSDRADAPAPEGSGAALRPHPLANDLTRENLAPAPPRPPAEEAEFDGVQIGVLRAVAPVVVLAGLVGVVVAAILIDEGALLAVGAAAVVLYMIILAAPVLLAEGAKAAQDESVRRADGRRGFTARAVRRLRRGRLQPRDDGR